MSVSFKLNSTLADQVSIYLYTQICRPAADGSELRWACMYKYSCCSFQ
jgi:hypothetical protein